MPAIKMGKIYENILPAARAPLESMAIYDMENGPFATPSLRLMYC